MMYLVFHSRAPTLLGAHEAGSKPHRQKYDGARDEDIWYVGHDVRRYDDVLIGLRQIRIDVLILLWKVPDSIASDGRHQRFRLHLRVIAEEKGQPWARRDG